MKKVIGLLIAVMFVCTPAFAGENPEYDTVGCDATNFFNDFVKKIVCLENVDSNGVIVNQDSDWCLSADCLIQGPEYFATNAALYATPDICFTYEGLQYASYAAQARVPGRYFEWQIVLQKMPDTDLNINIRDCVLKPNSTTMFGTIECQGAGQMGRYCDAQFGTVMLLAESPSITAWAVPGPLSTWTSYYLTARAMPTLAPVELKKVWFTSKGPWEESIVVKLPEDGEFDSDGNLTYPLIQTDKIKVRVDLSSKPTVISRYGKDNVSIKYVGVYGTETANPAAGVCSLLCGNTCF